MKLEIFEVFTALGRANKHEEKAKVLMDNDSIALRTLMRLNFDNRIKLNVSQTVEFEERTDGNATIHEVTKDYPRLTSLNISRDVADERFKDILESLDPREAKILNAAKNKKLKMRGLSRKLAIEVWGNRIFS